MAVTFVIGRAGTGKTHHCLEAIAAALRDPRDRRRLILLVPEQASLQMERALAARSPGGGFWRAEVLSFTRLARRILAQAGREPVTVRPAARRLALRRIVGGLDPAGGAFGRSVRTPGFFCELDRLIEELLSEGATPDALVQAARRVSHAGTRRRTEALAVVLERYLDWLGEERLDAALHLAALRIRLADVPWIAQSAFWLDGFAGFTGQELATLTALARSADQVTITLLMDPSAAVVRNADAPRDPLAPFDRVEQTYRRLRAELESAGVALNPPRLLRAAPPPRFASAPALARLEHGLAAPDASPAAAPGPSPTGGAVRLLRCATHRDELCEAARTIRRMILDSGGRLRYRDFALIARRLDPFVELIAEVFDEYEIPFFLDRRRPIRSHPLCRLMQALLDAVRDDLSVRSMSRLLRTGLLPLTRAQAEELEDLVVCQQMRGAALWRRPVWDRSDTPWRPLGETGADAAAAPPAEGRAGRDGARGPGDLDAARLAIVAALTPLLELAAGDGAEPGGAATGARWARVLLDALEALGVRERVSSWMAQAAQRSEWERAETHRLAWEALREALEDVHDVLGDTPLASDELGALLASAIGDVTLALAPPTLDQVLVGSIERSRHPDVRHVWVIAFNEGVFPAPPADEGVLSAADRRRLAEAGLPGLPPRRDDVLAERYLAYVALTRPSESLTVSFAALDEAGSELAPSPLVEELRRALPELAEESPERFAPPVTIHEAARGWLESSEAHAGDATARRRFGQLVDRLRSDPSAAPRIERLLRGRTYANQPPPIAQPEAHVDAAGVRVWRTTPSELESYVQCPFRHFAEHLLRLDPRQVGRPLVWDLGSVAHDLLAAALREAAGHGKVREMSDERWRAIVRETFARFDACQPPDLAERDPRLAFMIGLTKRLVDDALRAHAERYRRGRWEPAACEQPIGGNEPRALPALRIDVGGRRSGAAAAVEIRGRVDRLDRCPTRGGGELWLVYDYKAGAAWDRTPWLTGHRLTLTIYMLALARARGAGGRVVGGLIAPWRPCPAVLETRYVAAAPPLDQLMYMYRPRGVFETSAGPLLDERLSDAVYSAVANMRLTKDGNFYQNSDARPAETIRGLLRVAERTAAQAARDVLAGRVDVAPLLEHRELACHRCDFAAVCRFDPAYNTPRDAARHLPILDIDEGGG